MALNMNFWKGKKVLVTGHTGFKGSWLVYLLKELGAEVSGISLPPIEGNSLYKDLNIGKMMQNEVLGDIRDEDCLKSIFEFNDYNYVFHLAAQAFVLESYKDPIETLDVNILGTARVLQYALINPNLAGMGIITTDKVYRNQEWVWPYRESDPLGGLDPYSASKSAVEIVTVSLLNALNTHGASVICFRAGNVIGGGDWSPNRIVPDLVRSVQNSEELQIRHPDAVRPWQFILDCLFGYLTAAEKQMENPEFRPSAINFGPSSTMSVRNLVGIIAEIVDQDLQIKLVHSDFHESQQLKLDSSFALSELNWSPKYSPEKAARETAIWYSKYLQGRNPLEITRESLEAYLYEK